MKRLLIFVPITLLLCSCSDPSADVRHEIKKINNNIVVQKNDAVPTRKDRREIYQADQYRSPFQPPNEVIQAQARAQLQAKNATNASNATQRSQQYINPPVNSLSNQQSNTSSIVTQKKSYPNAITVDTNRSRDYLENFPLTSLKMTGIVGDGKNWLALIQTPNGNIIMAKVGDYVGDSFGRIMQINKTNIVVREAVKVEDGIYIPKTIIVPVISSQNSQVNAKSSTRGSRNPDTIAKPTSASTVTTNADTPPL